MHSSFKKAITFVSIFVEILAILLILGIYTIYILVHSYIIVRKTNQIICSITKISLVQYNIMHTFIHKYMNVYLNVIWYNITSVYNILWWSCRLLIIIIIIIFLKLLFDCTGHNESYTIFSAPSRLNNLFVLILYIYILIICILNYIFYNEHCNGSGQSI